MSFGLALSVGHESDAEYLDVELTRAGRPRRARRAAHRRRCPRGSTSPAPSRWSTARPHCRSRSPPSSTGSTAVDADGEPSVPAAVLRASVDARARERRAARHPHPQGQARASTTSVPPSAASSSASTTPDTPRARARPVDATPRRPTPRGARRPRSLAGVGLTERRVLRTAQWIERDGARLEPLAADALARALEARAS